MKIPIFPKIRQKFAYSKFTIRIILKKVTVLKFFFSFIFLFYLTSVLQTVPIFESIGPLVAEIWGGGGQISPPPPPNGLRVLEITQWE